MANSTGIAGTVFRANPILRKVEKRTFNAEAKPQKTATYAGVFGKTFFFIILMFVGMASTVVLDKTVFASYPHGSMVVNGVTVSYCIPELLLYAVSLVLLIITAILGNFWVSAAPVLGIIYSLSQGYMLTMTFKFVPQYREVGVAAIAVTALIVLVMAVLYLARIIKVTEKFRSIMLTAFVGVIAASVLGIAFSFIPATKQFMSALQNNLPLSIGISVVMIVIVSMVLLSDFDVIERTVKHGMPRKYEWGAALGLTFTVVWLYLKVLGLLAKLKKAN